MSGVTLKSLSAHSRTAELVSQCVELFKDIDGRLTIANSNGESHIRVELPTIFPLSKLPKRDAQLWVYSELVVGYQKKGFSNITLQPDGDRMWMRIEWPNGLSDTERAAREQVLAAAMCRQESAR